jgi:hypothetical protein
MTDLFILFRDKPNFIQAEPNLYYLTNFTESYTMEDKKGQNNFKSLEDWKKELQQKILSPTESLKIYGGKTLEKDKWNSGCGGIVPQ